MKKHPLAFLLVPVLLSFPAHAEGVAGADRELRAEQALHDLGYHSSDCDEISDEESLRAVLAFQKANQLPETGQLDDATYSAIFSTSAVSASQYLKKLSDSYAGQAILQAGCTGEEVARLQTRLTELGFFSGECDGIFGEITQQGVLRFQLANGLTQTGIADSSTQLRLYEGTPVTRHDFITGLCCSYGEKGVKVHTVQCRLAALGYFTGSATGCYGNMTRRAVLAFQQANGLEQTDRIDEVTCEMLYSDAVVTKAQSYSLNPDTETGNMILSRLTELGYLSDTMASETVALKLFQAACSREMNGEPDDELLEILFSDTAPSLKDAAPSFAAVYSAEDPEAAERTASAARALLGQKLSVTDAAGCIGFDLVQQVCLSAGLPISTPEDILNQPRALVDEHSSPAPGDIVVFRREETDWSRLMLAVCTQPGFVAYADSTSGFVLERSIQLLATKEISTWTPGVIIG